VANYVKIDFVINAAIKGGCRLWRMWDDSGELLYKQDSETMAIEESMRTMREVFEGVAGEFVLIQVTPRVLKKGGDQITNVFKYRVACVDSSPINSERNLKQPANDFYQGKTQNYGNDITAQLIALNVMIAEQKKDAQINALERKLDELKSNKGNNKSQLLEKYLMKIFLEPETKKATLPIAGTTTQAPAEPTPQAQPVNGNQDEKRKAAQRLAIALQKLKNVDSNFVSSLEKLATFAEKNPEQFNQYLEML